MKCRLCGKDTDNEVAVDEKECKYDGHKIVRYWYICERCKNDKRAMEKIKKL